jgi:hypothetical protein
MSDENNDDTTAPEEAHPEGDTHTPPKRWYKGMESPNKSGRPTQPKTVAEVRALAREKTGAMLEFLSRTALNPKVPINARVTCAIEILNRGYGRPHQSMDLNHGVQDGLAAFLEQIDGRYKIKTIEGSVERPALEAQQSLLDHGQERQPDSIPTKLGTGESSE